MVNNKKDENIGLETLLQLDGEVFPMDNGYWVKFKVHRVEPNEHIPHGIRYSFDFESALNLMEDFWKDVNDLISK